ncbi:sodium:neurotransmitter symporter family domain-containing protein [Phthorimaea operculella]|nr:sodium:neurotransmitter symporter family domain-containing protein [Phthorimaea operculella]
MSDTVSSPTKTGTRSSNSDSLSSDPPIKDRWSHNITYRELVASSCIGIMQLWWHPYLYSVKKLVPFLFLYNLFSVFIGLPMFYLELAVGVVTKKGVLNCWDLSPLARGVGLSMLITAAFTALATSATAAWPVPPDADTPAASFFYNYVLRLKRDGVESGLGTVVTELSIYFAICWILIYCIAFKRIYSISKLVMFKDTLAAFVLITACVGCVRLKGAGEMIRSADWSVLITDFQIWREAAEFALIQMTVSQGTQIMLGAQCPRQQHGLSRTAMMSFGASKLFCMVTALTLGAVHGALRKDYETDVKISKGAAASIILWADYVARIPGSQFWSALFFFTLFVLALTSTAITIHTIMSTFTGHSIRKITWAFLILTCVLFMFIGILVCTQGGLYIVDFIMTWPITKPRVVIAAVIALIVTFAYGQTTFCEDVFFAVGEYPNVFMRVCWAFTPFILIILFLGNLSLAPTRAAWILVSVTLAPIFIIMLIYLVFKFRVRNIVGTEK